MAARIERRLRRVLTGVALSATLLFALILGRAVMQPLTLDSAASVQVLDRQGELLRWYTTRDGYWRLPAQLEALDQRFLSMLLAYEDARFYSHPGVDIRALLRASWQALRQGRFVSGGSTLSMQTLRLLEPRARTLWSKLVEIGRALRLEQQLNKAQILRLYLTLAPYGGNIQGVRAASLLYFGKQASFLTPAESALLVALPQSPERRRPDRFPAHARAARDRVLARMQKAGVLAAEEVARAREAAVPTRRIQPPRLAAHLSDRLRQNHTGDQPIRTQIDRRLQEKLEALVSRHQLQLAETTTLAVLLAHNRSASVRAYVGSGDYAATRFPGQVDMIRAQRSPGSALKPFIYGFGFDAGFIHPNTLINDRPGAVDGYAPGNFDGRYAGEISIREALQQSRNIPAVKVLQRLGANRFAEAMRQAGVRLRLPGSAPRAGLPLALGGVGVSLEDMLQVYSALPNSGEVRPLSLLQDDPQSVAKPLLSSKAAWYLSDILANAPLPAGFTQAAANVAFKTGTSYGFRDAWAIGYDAEYSVGVWVGRPDGGYTPGLAGLHNAVPIMLEVFDLLPAASMSPLLGKPPETILLAEHAQLPAALRYFDREEHRRLSSRAGPVILYPPEGSLVELDQDGEAMLNLEARGGRLPFHWLVNGRYVQTQTAARDWHWRPLLAGLVRMTVIDAEGRSDSVNFRLLSAGEQ
jgi:penicillin-binding protein 1C